jgi:hypothetical protein
MCDGEDRIVVVKKESWFGWGSGGVIKLAVFRATCTKDPRRRQNRVGNVWLQGFFEVEKGSGGGLGLYCVLVGATRHCLGELLLLVPWNLRCCQSLDVELAEGLAVCCA